MPGLEHKTVMISILFCFLTLQLY